MKRRSKWKTAVILLTVVAVLAAAGGGGWYYFQNRDTEPVKVFPFQYIGMTEYWGDSQESYGPVTTDRIQTVFLSATQTVTEVLVAPGDTVKKGDILMTYDTTLSDLALERERLQVEKLKLQLDSAEDELWEIQNMTPMVVPETPEIELPEPDLGTALLGSYQISQNKAYDGSSMEKALILWLHDSASLSDSVFEQLRLTAQEYQNSNQPAATEPTTVPTEPTTAPVESTDPSADPTVPSVDSSTDPTTEATDPSTDPTTETTDPSADPTTEATDPSTDPTTEATDPSTDPTTEATDPSADPTTEATDPSADPTTVATDPSADPTTEATDSSTDPTTEATDPSTDPTTQPTDPTTVPTVPPTVPTPKPTDVSRYYVVIKVTDGNMSLGYNKLWQGLEITGSGSGFQLKFFDAGAVEDHTVKREEAEEPELPQIDIGSGFTSAQIAQMRAEKERQIRDLQFQVKMAEANYAIKQTEMENGNVAAGFDGVVVSLLDQEEAKLTNQPFMKISGGGGFYVEGFVSELTKADLQIGQEVTVQDWNTGMEHVGTVQKIGDFPAANGYWNGMGNPNASYYPFTVFIDGSADLQEGSYVNVVYSTATTQQGIYLENPFLRTEQGLTYVYVRGEDGKLQKRPVTTGKALWGSYTEILEGLSPEDLIAFPYGKTVVEGADTVESDLSELYG